MMSETTAQPVLKSSISTHPRIWFVRGFLIGGLLCATANAVSYFFRSEHWGNLLGNHQDSIEAIGFPVKMWEAGNAYGGFYIDYPSLLTNLGFAALIGALLGALTWACYPRLNSVIHEIESQLDDTTSGQNFQFSMKGLLLSTFVVALLAAAMRNMFAQQREALGAIFLLGPWILVGLALLPRKIAWQHRVGLIIPLTIGLILVAVGIGATVGRELEQVILGIYVCWTPQTVLVAAGLTTVLLASFAFRRHGAAQPDQQTQT